MTVRPRAPKSPKPRASSSHTEASTATSCCSLLRDAAHRRFNSYIWCSSLAALAATARRLALQAAKSVSSIAGYSHGRRYHAGAASTHLKVCEGGILQSNGCWLCCKLYVLVHLFVCARALHLNLEPKIPDLPTWSEGFHNHMLWSGRMY